METKLRALDQAHHRMVKRHVTCLVKFDKICTGFPKHTSSCEQRVLFLLVVLNVHFLKKTEIYPSTWFLFDSESQ